MSKKFGLLSRYRTLADLPQVQSSLQALPKDRRAKYEICVVDDETFDAGRNLRNYGYKFSEIGDLKKIEEVAAYPIVLCDLMGVGLHFDDRKQGATLIREIRRNYPSIMVAAYSGASIGSEQAKAAMMFADQFIQKDAEYDTWTQVLDNLIRDAADYRKVWNRLRVALVEDGVDTKILLKLEDAYVESIRSGQTEPLAEQASKDKTNLTKFAGDVLTAFLSGAMLKLLGI